MQVLCPSSFAELEHMLDTAINEMDGPVAIRYPRGGEGAYKVISTGGTEVLRHGSDITLAAYGTMINQMLELSEALAKDGISAEVIKISQIKPLSTDEIIASLKKTKKLLTAEDVCEHGCIGEALLSAAEEAGICLEGASICTLGAGLDQLAVRKHAAHADSDDTGLHEVGDVVRTNAAHSEERDMGERCTDVLEVLGAHRAGRLSREIGRAHV